MTSMSPTCVIFQLASMACISLNTAATGRKKEICFYPGLYKFTACGAN